MRLPVIYNIDSRDGTLSKGSKIVNGYAEIQGEEGFVYSRPAIRLVNSTFSTFGGGLFAPPRDFSGNPVVSTDDEVTEIMVGVNGTSAVLYRPANLPATDANWRRWDGVLSSGSPVLGVNDGTLATLLVNYAPITWDPAVRVGVQDVGGVYHIYGPDGSPTGAGATAVNGITSQPTSIATGSYVNGSPAFSGTSLGTVLNPNSVLASFAQAVSGVVFIKLDTAAYTYNGSALTLVSDAQYPANTVRGAPYLNGIFYVMDTDGNIWGSAEDDPTSWTSTNLVVAEFEPDGGVFLGKQVEYIIALGTYTTEFFYDAGIAAPTSALAPVQNGVLLIGCAHANSVAQTESALCWVAQQKAQGTTFHKGRFVVILEGLGYKRISTPDVERILDADAFVNVYADILTVSGHMFYVLSLVGSSITLVFDFKTSLWHQWTRSTDGTPLSISALTQSNGVATATSTSHGLSDGDQVTVSGATQAGYNLTVNITRVDANTFTYPVAAATVSPATGTIAAAVWSQGVFDISASCYFSGSQVAQFRTNGYVYVLEPTETDDDNDPIDFQIVTSKFDGKTVLPKFCPRVEVIADKVSSTGLLRYSDDDFQTWSTYRRMDMSLDRVALRRLGRFSRRAFQFRHTLSARLRLEALEPFLEQGR